MTTVRSRKKLKQEKELLVLSRGKCTLLTFVGLLELGLRWKVRHDDGSVCVCRLCIDLNSSVQKFDKRSGRETSHWELSTLIWDVGEACSLELAMS
jgi:hypothetical protein